MTIIERIANKALNDLQDELSGRISDANRLGALQARYIRLRNWLETYQEEHASELDFNAR